jgi:enoyl-CoA hydratase/carnithine racemase
MLEIQIDIKGHTGYISLNRPKALNALSLPMIRALMAQLLA